MSVPASYLKKRDMLHSEKSPPQTLTALGNEYMRMERYSDALDFFEKARDQAGLTKIKEVALSNADSFLLSKLARASREMVTTADWEKVAGANDVNGRKSMAEFARKKFAPAEIVQVDAHKAALLAGSSPIEEL